LPEWLYEEGIGENRAILVERDDILEAAIELPGALRAGAVVPGRLREIVMPHRRGWVESAGSDILVAAVPAGLTQGQQLRVEIVREAIGERGKTKSAIGRITDAAQRDAPTLAQRIGAHTAIVSTDPDRFEAAGWPDLLEEAATGEIAFTGGELRLNLTPAMTLFDVDGFLPAAELAVAGAAAAARAIRRHGVGGSIGIDLPTVRSKDDRIRAAEAFDAALPQPFERTAVNGFGFLQVVRKRERASLPELLQYAPVAAAARALLRRAERSSGHGERVLAASPPVIAFLEARPDWLDDLRRRTGTGLRLQADGALTNWSFHVQSAHS
jgi:Ribonuclease G/E